MGSDVLMIMLAAIVSAAILVAWIGSGGSLGMSRGRRSKGNIYEITPKHEVIMVEVLDPEVWDERLLDWVLRAADKVRVEIVTGPYDQGKCGNIVRQLLSKGVELWKLNFAPTEHFLILDRAAGNFEKIHLPGKKPEDSEFVRHIYSNVADWYLKEFERFKSMTVPVS